MKTVFFTLLLLTSCASILSSGSPKETKQQYAYIDGSGKYVITREHKLIKKNKLISRTQLSLNQGSAVKPLEKSIMVSQLGTIKEKNKRVQVMRPFASEFTVWLEGKRYNSKMQLDVRNKSMVVELDSPEAKWKGKSSIPIPKGKQFCFYSQIPDCLYHNSFLSKAIERKDENIPFYVVWDGYPFIQDQLTGVGTKLFAPANVKFEGDHKNVHRFLVEVEGQSIIYHFSKTFDLVRMFWIAQGISVVPPNEDVAEGDE